MVIESETEFCVTPLICLCSLRARGLCCLNESIRLETTLFLIIVGFVSACCLGCFDGNDIVVSITSDKSPESFDFATFSFMGF